MTDSNDRPNSDEEPRTIGELRRRLAEMGNPWSVDPQLNDEEPLRHPPRGGQSDADVPQEFRRATEITKNVDEVLTAEPPANPFLRELWAQYGLLDDGEGR